MAKYVYCIIRDAEERALDGIAPVGMAPGPVHTIVHEGLAAVVNDCDATRFETSRANLMAHQAVLERVMTGFPLLPVRFGTVTGPEDGRGDVWKLLGARQREFDRLLIEMDRRVEVGIKALWRDPGAVFQEILADNRAVRELRDRVQGHPPPAVRLERIRLGEMVKDALDRKRAALAGRILAPLRRLAPRVVENPVLLDRMILNAAFLVDRDRDLEFDRAVRELGDRLAPQVSLKYVGPVPPYNFVNVVVDWDAVRSS